MDRRCRRGAPASEPARRSPLRARRISTARPGVGPVRSAAVCVAAPSRRGRPPAIDASRQHQRVGEDDRVVDDDAGRDEHEPASRQLMPPAGQQRQAAGGDDDADDAEDPGPTGEGGSGEHQGRRSVGSHVATQASEIADRRAQAEARLGAVGRRLDVARGRTPPSPTSALAARAGASRAIACTAARRRR